MGNAQDLQFLVCQPNPTEHQSVATECFDRVDTHATHQFLDFVVPGRHQIDKPLTADIGIQTFHKIRTLGCDAPVALAALTGTAKVTAHSQQCGSCHIAGIGTQSDCLDHVRCTADAAAYYQGYIVANALVAEPLINGGQSQFNGNAHIIPDSGRCCTGTAPETVNSDNVRATASDAAGNGGDVMDSGDLYNSGFLYSVASFKE